MSIDNPLTLLIGNGMYGDDDDIDFTDAPDDYYPEEMDEFDNMDEFEAPPQPLDGKYDPAEVDESGMSDF